MIAIIDYGMGNIHSVQKALQNFGAETTVTSKPADIEKAEKIVLPGVGAFDDAMAELQKQGLIPAVHKQILAGKPFLGICLGMQLLFESSEESKGAKGLAVLKGKVKRFPGNGLKVPHMGWNQLKIQNPDCPLLKGVPQGAFVYFCHSYYPENRDPSDTAATTDYGRDFSSMVWRKNVFGAQFHPEKSQKTGLAILRNFVQAC